MKRKRTMIKKKPINEMLAVELRAFWKSDNTHSASKTVTG